MPSKQETFDTVVGALIKQGRPSVGEGKCKYRGPNGDKCAVGHLIPDSKYRETMEGRAINDMAVFYVVQGLGHNVALVESLQMAHDDYSSMPNFMSNFIAMAKEISRDYRLEWNFDVTLDNPK